MSAPVIVLPGQFQGRTLSRVAAEVVACSPNGQPKQLHEITFDFSGLNFIRPAGVVFLSNLFWWLHHQGIKIRLAGTNVHTPAICFLDDSLFFEQHAGRKLREDASPRATTRPLIRIAHQDSHSWLETNLVPWLAGRLGITRASVYSVKNCVAELFNNIKDHTQLEIGSIFVQHFPNENGVMISLSDFGVGIPYKVREQIPNLSDSQAIIYSVREGFTTKSTPGNKGIGLDYLLQTVVAHNGGQVTIYSGDSMVRFVRVKSGILPIPSAAVGLGPGTTLDLNLRTDAIAALPEESEDLQW